MLDLFRYGVLPRSMHLIMLGLGWLAALYWLYFTIIHKELLQRLLKGETHLLDALVGFPLILALAVVVYAIVFWLLKVVVILIAPHRLTMPKEEGEHEFDPSDPDVK